jgi:hypothetical protein
MFIRTKAFKLALSLLWIFPLAPMESPASTHGSKLTSHPGPTDSALVNANFGLFPAEGFRFTTGKCNNCPTPKQALWYFDNELIAVPKNGMAVAGLAATRPGYDRVLRAIEAVDGGKEPPHPSVVWVGSRDIVEHASLSSEGNNLTAGDGTQLRLSLIPKLATNRSYYDHSTSEFFRRRSLRVRGAANPVPAEPSFVARTIWPEDFRIDADALAREPLPARQNLTRLITGDDGGAKSPFETRLLWESAEAKERNWVGMPVLGLLLSGGQGDDDESQAGHLAVVTGRMGPNGEMADWMVNNFYNLDEVSEKGIIASMLPLDNYLMDLNSGQSYYRPTYMLVAVLKDTRAASRFQAAIEPIYNHFYRHDFLYHHSKVNCTGISVDTLRAIGWQIPRKGTTSYLKAVAAFTYLSVRDRSFASGKKMFDYLTEEQTRLFPRAAFEVAAEDLLAIVNGRAEHSGRRLTVYENTLRDDVAAVLFIRIPQIPSSRASGTYPVASFDEYRNRVPADRSKWKIVPVDARPFPEDLREPLPTESHVIDWFPVVILPIALAFLAISKMLIFGNRSGSRKLLLNYPRFSPKNRS